MAGSYNHVVTEDGKLRSPESLAAMLENGGDVYEAVEEMYGMIWWLADSIDHEIAGPKNYKASLVKEAQENYKYGLQNSPGKEDV